MRNDASIFSKYLEPRFLPEASFIANESFYGVLLANSLSETENENTENRNRKIILSPKIETKTEKKPKVSKIFLKTKKCP